MMDSSCESVKEKGLVNYSWCVMSDGTIQLDPFDPKHGVRLDIGALKNMVAELEKPGYTLDRK